jgi:NADPH:quinone reductase-like Zn-dependent oxidoreductase
VATGGSFGAWAEFFVAKAAGLIPVAEGLPDEAAAQLVSMPFSAISLIDSLDLQPGAWIVQNAANGAVGRMVAQIGVARGLNVIGLVRRTAGVAELAAQGIDRIVATDAADWRDRVAEITGGAPIAAGVDSVGGTASGDVLSLLGENGTLVVFGAMDSPTMQLASGDVIFRQITVRGFWGSRVSTSMAPAKRAELFGELGGYVASGVVTLPVAGVYGFDDIADAVRASNTAGRVGKVLLRP